MVFHMGQGPAALGNFFADFPGHEQGAGHELETLADVSDTGHRIGLLCLRGNADLFLTIYGAGQSTGSHLHILNKNQK